MLWRLLGLFLGQLAIFSLGLVVTRRLVPMEEYPFSHVGCIALSGLAAILFGLAVARRLDL